MNVPTTEKTKSTVWMWWVVGPTALLVALLFAVSPNFVVGDSPTAEPFGGDFLQEWLGGYIVRDGDHTRFYDVGYAQSLQHDRGLIGFEWDHAGYLPIVYPPFYYLVISPLSHLPLTVAAYVWCLLMAACFIATGWFLGNGVRVSQKIVAVLFPVSLMFVPLIENFNSCQKGTFVLMLLSASYVLLEKKRGYSAGVVFGLVAFKPQLTLVIAAAMLLKRQWRFVLGGMTTGLGLLGLSALLGFDVCRQYVEFATHAGEYLQTAGYDLHKAHSWSGACHLLLQGLPSSWIKAATFVPALATLAVLTLTMRGPLDTMRPKFAVQFSALVVGTLLLSPHLLSYDLVLLLLPAFLMARMLVEQGRTADGTLKAIGWLLVVLFAVSGLLSPIAAATRIQPSVFIMFALLLLMSRLAVSVTQGVPPLPSDNEDGRPTTLNDTPVQRDAERAGYGNAVAVLSTGGIGAGTSSFIEEPLGSAPGTQSAQGGLQ